MTRSGRRSWTTLPLLWGALAAACAGPAPDPSPASALEPAAELFHQAVEWSPDGLWLAFSEYSGGDGEFSFEDWSIHVISPHGTGRRRVVDQGVFLSWAPDGRRLAFDSPLEGGWSVYTVGLDGGDLRRVTDGAARNDQPAWSPDGRQLAFRSDRDGNGELYLLELESGEVRRLTRNEAEDLNPAWSPDGAGLVFFRERGDGRDQIHVVMPEGGELRVTDGTGHNFYPGFLPDGRVGFTRVEADGRKRLAVAPAEGGPAEVLSIEGIPAAGGETAGDEAAAVLQPSYARWSPDGRRVAFIAGRWPATAIYVMDADGGGLRKIVN